MNSQVDCAALVAAVPDAVIASDARGLITLWNPGAQRLFGWTEAEALGRSLDLITPERLQQRHWDGYEKSMASGTTKYGTTLLKVPAVHRDGHALSIAFTVAMLFDDAGRVASVVAVIRDETERFQQERALRQRIAELENEINERRHP